MEVKTWKESTIEILKDKFPEREICEKDWRAPIRESLLKDKDVVELKAVKDYILMKGELYRKMPGGILLRCVGPKEAQRKLEEVHNRTCGFCKEVSLSKLQRVGFYWPNMNREANQIQSQCEAYRLVID